jgi:hypothetical protein
LRESLNTALKKQWQGWEIPHEAEAKWPGAPNQTNGLQFHSWSIQ